MPGNARHAASISLGVMGAGYLAALPFQTHPAGALLQGAFEAGLVGGLADWFAVTALFRHPLGIPIPHTALLPNNRGKLTDALVGAVQNNLLNKESIAEKIGDMHLADALLAVLEKEIHTEDAKTAIDSLCKRLIRDFPFDPLLPYLEKEIKRQLGSIDASAVASFAMHEMMTRGVDEKALDFLLDKAERWIVQPETRDRLGALAMSAIGGLQLNGLMQFALNAFLAYLSEEKLGDMIQQFAFGQIRELRTEDNPRRAALLTRLRAELESTASDPRFQAGLERLKVQLLEQWQPGDQMARMAERFRENALASMEDGAYVETHVLPFLTRLIGQLRADEAVLSAMEDRMKRILIDLLEQNHAKIGRLVRENIDRMDNETLIAMMEQNVGKDLQWIRVNGAVCGFILGLVLTGIRLFAG